MWSIKDYVLSGAVEAFSEEFSIVAWVPPQFAEGTAQLLSKKHTEKVTVRPFRAFNLGSAHAAVCKLQKSFRYERYDVDTEHVYNRRRTNQVVRARGPIQRRASGIVRRLAKSPLAGPGECLLGRLRRRLVPRGCYEQEFSQFQIGLVMTTDPTRREADSLYFDAKRQGLALTTLPLSWDNLTSKGVIHGGFAKVMVWNEVMRVEIATMYPWYRPEQVVVVGFPRFDLYRRPFQPRYERDPFLRSLGLDPTRPVLLFASSAAEAFRAQYQVVEHLCDTIARAEIKPGIQLLIRCHPHDNIQEMSRFRGRHDIAVWPEEYRGRTGTLFSQLPDPEELQILGASVAHSAAVITAGSSVMLDAARCDVPVICVGYDGDMRLPPEDSISSVYDYSHQKPFHQLGATDICYSRDELVASIRRALLEPGRQAPNRRAVVNRYLGGYASSIDRIREVLTSLASEQLTTRS